MDAFPRSCLDRILYAVGEGNVVSISVVFSERASQTPLPCYFPTPYISMFVYVNSCVYKCVFLPFSRMPSCLFSLHLLSHLHCQLHDIIPWPGPVASRFTPSSLWPAALAPNTGTSRSHERQHTAMRSPTLYFDPSHCLKAANLLNLAANTFISGSTSNPYV